MLIRNHIHHIQISINGLTEIYGKCQIRMDWVSKTQQSAPPEGKRKCSESKTKPICPPSSSHLINATRFSPRYPHNLPHFFPYIFTSLHPTPLPPISISTPALPLTPSQVNQKFQTRAWTTVREKNPKLICKCLHSAPTTALHPWNSPHIIVHHFWAISLEISGLFHAFVAKKSLANLNMKINELKMWRKRGFGSVAEKKRKNLSRSKIFQGRNFISEPEGANNSFFYHS